MYTSKCSVMFLGMKKQSFNDSDMFKIDIYVGGEVDSFFVQSNNPILNDLQKVKPTSMISCEIQWNKSREGWKHRLLSVSAGV